MTYHPTRNLPAKDFKAYLPRDYRKKTVNLIVTETCHLHDVNWSGGTKNTYSLVRLADNESVTPRLDQYAPWENRYEGAKIPMQSGFLIICTGHFCGKERTATIHVHPADMPKLLETT
jgi:hypothetical protein